MKHFEIDHSYFQRCFILGLILEDSCSGNDNRDETVYLGSSLELHSVSWSDPNMLGATL